MINRVLDENRPSFLGISLPTVGGVAVVFTALALLLRPGENVLADIAVGTFGLSGTMAALVLPAAQLAGQLTVHVVEYWLNRITTTGDRLPPTQQEYLIALDMIVDAKNLSLLAWRGCIYVGCALVVSATAVFASGTKVYWIPINYFILSIAFGFILVGVRLFFPFARWAFSFGPLWQLENILRALTNQEARPNLRILPNRSSRDWTSFRFGAIGCCGIGLLVIGAIKLGDLIMTSKMPPPDLNYQVAYTVGSLAVGTHMVIWCLVDYIFSSSTDKQ